MKKNYSTEKTNPYFYGNYSVVEGELNYSYTVSFFNLIDLTKIEEVRRSAKGDSRPSYTAFIAKAVAMAMQEFPYANRRFYRPLGFFSRRFQKFNTVDIAIASEVTIPDVEYVAFFDVLRNVEEKSVSEIGEWLYRFRSNTEQNQQWNEFKTIMTRLPQLLGKFLIRLPVYVPSMWARYRGGAVMISSPAKYGVDGVIASWPTPIGISFGLVKDRVIAENGKATVKPTLYLTMNFDRRLMAGAPAARFFNRIVEHLEGA